MKGLLVALFTVVLVFTQTTPTRAQSTSARISMLDRNNRPVTSLVDGNQVSLGIELSADAGAAMQVDFLLAGVDAPVASCSIPRGDRVCRSASFSALGWFWNADGLSQLQREVAARGNGEQLAGSLTVNVAPRPVVLVHGFTSDYTAWVNYLGPQGYLAPLGLHGYAVGDGQVPGVMNTGSMKDPTARTNSIAQNAAVLGEYINGVQKATGAERVDLVVHSMGGMIARYYLDRVMTDVNAAQLIILGTPMAGSDCADLPAALGILLPASLEIQPSYMVGVFNQQIVHRRGVPFYAIAGRKLLDAVESPCTPVPSDLVVTVDSVKAIPMPVQEITLLHIELNTSPEVFQTFVKPHLQTPPGKFESPADPPPGSNPPVSQQFTKVYTGHLNPGQTQDVVINIDANVTVANFALYDTSRSLDASVIGASGKQIQLDTVKNGVIRVDDPSTMVYLGYGFKEPKPGKWIVTLHTTETTPPEGAFFAINAKFDGGAQLQVNTNVTVPKVGQSVTISANLTDAGASALLDSAQVVVRRPDGSAETFEMLVAGNTATLTLKPSQTGIHGVEVSVAAHAQDGSVIDRAVFLTFEAEPTTAIITTNRVLFLGGIMLVVILITRFVRGRKKRRAV
jgi:pimeloyl-ACP methyl ester carboxylesterase